MFCVVFFKFNRCWFEAGSQPFNQVLSYKVKIFKIQAKANSNQNLKNSQKCRLKL
ncbi:hypothetical protein F383_34077 [Gossypium arboreum]|uniref:Uncharacterized protein n=1 Tax=Gossypium arboreum TaxID=29729 RepID=A0A0B0MZN2_GOSAR|nr:hypothetical protein F383_34077 [Gossypium arboreum]